MFISHIPSDALTACMENPDLMFGTRPKDVELAKSACAACAFRAPCLEDAMTTDQTIWGIMAGRTPEELRAMRGRRRLDIARKTLASNSPDSGSHPGAADEDAVDNAMLAALVTMTVNGAVKSPFLNTLSAKLTNDGIDIRRSEVKTRLTAIAQTGVVLIDRTPSGIIKQVRVINVPAEKAS